MAVSDITNPPMDDDPDGTASPSAAPDGDTITNPPMDDDPDSAAASGSDIENPPA